MKTKIIVVCVMLVSFLAGCATNPVTGKSEVQIMGKDWETNVGREAAQEVEKEFANGDINPQLQSYRSQFGKCLCSTRRVYLYHHRNAQRTEH